MLVGPTLSLWHQETVLAQGRGFFFSLPDRIHVYLVTSPVHRRRATPGRYAGNVERKLQPVAYELDPVADFDTLTGRRTLAVHAHMTTGYRRGRLAACLEKTAEVQPAIDAQSARRIGHLSAIPLGNHE